MFLFLCVFVVTVFFLLQAPPCFHFTSGFWGTQNVLIKKIDKKKLKTPHQLINGHDLLIAELNAIKLVVINVL